MDLLEACVAMFGRLFSRISRAKGPDRATHGDSPMDAMDVLMNDAIGGAVDETEVATDDELDPPRTSPHPMHRRGEAGSREDGQRKRAKGRRETVPLPRVRLDLDDDDADLDASESNRNGSIMSRRRVPRDEDGIADSEHEATKRPRTAATLAPRGASRRNEEAESQAITILAPRGGSERDDEARVDQLRSTEAAVAEARVMQQRVRRVAFVEATRTEQLASILSSVVPRGAAPVESRGNVRGDAAAAVAAVLKDQEHESQLDRSVIAARIAADLQSQDFINRRTAAGAHNAVMQELRSQETLLQVTADASQRIAERDVMIVGLTMENDRLRALVAKLMAELDQYANDWKPPPPSSVQQIIELYENDQFNEDEHGLATALLKGVGRALFADVNGECKKRIVYSGEERSFYGLLLAYGGHFVVELVSDVLGGPSLSSVLRWRREHCRLIFGVSYEAIDHNLGITAETLTNYNLMGSDIRFILTEDGTAAKKHIDVVKERGPDKKLRIVVYGLSNGLLIAPKSIEEVVEAAQKQGLATTFYAISIVPLVEGAPALPIVATANSNDFDTTDVRDVLFKIYRAAKKHGLAGKIIGDVSDGDSRLRRLAMQFMHHEGSPARKYISIDHPLLQLRLPWIDDHGFHAQLGDWMHIIWRMRTNFLKDEMEFIQSVSRDTIIKIMKSADLPLNAADMNPHFKQNWTSCLKMAGLKTDRRGTNTIEALEGTEAKGEVLFFTLMQKYIQLFTVETLSLDERIKAAGFVLYCLADWKMVNTKKFPNEALEKTCFTAPTFTDIVWSTGVFVLVVKLLRDDEEKGLWPEPRRLSSRFSEYLFAYCRSEHKNAVSFGPYAGMTHINHYIHSIDLEFQSGVELPSSRHGVKKGPSRVSRPNAEEVARRRDELQACTDERIKELLDVGGGEFVALCLKLFPDEPESKFDLSAIKKVDLLGNKKEVPPAFFRLDGQSPPPPAVASAATSAAADDAVTQDEADAPDGGDDMISPRDVVDSVEAVSTKFAELMDKSKDELKAILRRLNFKVSGNKPELARRILGDAASVVTSSTPAPKKLTKKEESRRKLFQVCARARDVVKAKRIRDGEAAADAAELPDKLPGDLEGQYQEFLLWQEGVNHSISQLSRERTGTRSRFAGQHVLGDLVEDKDVSAEQRAIEGQFYLDRHGCWRIVSADDNLRDAEDVQLKGVFYDPDAEEVMVLLFPGKLTPKQAQEQKKIVPERYDSVMATSLGFSPDYIEGPPS